jgi:transcriptional regulator with XRE-family HTH domain
MAEELPALLEQAGWSVRALAQETGISHPHLWRIIRREKGGTRPSIETIEAITKALGLPPDYFPEAREARVIEALQRDPALRERFYRTILMR